MTHRISTYGLLWASNYPLRAAALKKSLTCRTEKEVLAK